MKEYFGFHAFFPANVPREDALRHADSAAAGVVLGCVGFEGGLRPRITYGRPGLSPLPVRFDFGERWNQWGMYPVAREVFEEHGAVAVGSFLRGLCERVGVVLGRSLKEDHHAVAHEREIEGPLEYIEWFQYLGPAHVARWGAEYLQRGPFHRVEVLPSGACALWLRESPYDPTERESTRRGAEYLGIKLRPHLIRESDGSLVELKWP